MQAKLIDAAERILQAGAPLTAGEVASAAGIARNSLYRYVDSVEDLRILVLNRHLPQWGTVVGEAMAQADSPGDKVLAYVRASLEEGAPGRQAWVMRTAGGIAPAERKDLDEAHAALEAVLDEQIAASGAENPELVATIIHRVLDAGFERMEAGDDPDQVVGSCLGAVSGLLIS